MINNTGTCTRILDYKSLKSHSTKFMEKLIMEVKYTCNVMIFYGYENMFSCLYNMILKFVHKKNFLILYDNIYFLSVTPTLSKSFARKFANKEKTLL